MTKLKRTQKLRNIMSPHPKTYSHNTKWLAVKALRIKCNLKEFRILAMENDTIMHSNMYNNLINEGYYNGKEKNNRKESLFLDHLEELRWHFNTDQHLAI